ncbi:xanthine dehydrogenase small subunit [bacterium AH-315-M05]|nr:xanthine dehydrogenase small subunit [bacterium AH-315-M05]
MSNTKSTISFILDDKIVEIDFNKTNHSPTLTVLNYLRSLPAHKGTKEGCAEGDCGACTVVVGRISNPSTKSDSPKIQYESWDSCLVFLPMLNGLQLITVENVGTSGNLHPVQQAMVETDGSQCGFCTPGFIMSLFELYKNDNNPSREVIDDALTGNLCRCTGYHSIVEAAARSCVNNGLDRFTKKEPEIIKLLTMLNKNKESISIITEKQKYFRPANLKEALKLRDENPNAILLSGATDIALRVTKNKELLTKIIDLTGIYELQQVKENNNSVTIGSGVNLEKVKTISAVNFPALYDMLYVFGSRQIRNLATLGGNLGSASPISDTPPVLMAYEAIIILESVDGKREIPAVDFITGYRTTKMKSNEIITAVRIPKLRNGKLVKSYKISKRKDLDISTVSGSFRLELDETNTVNDILLVYGGMAAMIKRAEKAEEFLIGKQWDRETVEQAMELINEEFTPISDARSGEEGRKVMARNLLLKFWSETNKNIVTQID